MAVYPARPSSRAWFPSSESAIHISSQAIYRLASRSLHDPGCVFHSPPGPDARRSLPILPHPYCPTTKSGRRIVLLLRGHACMARHKRPALALRAFAPVYSGLDRSSTPFQRPTLSLTSAFFECGVIRADTRPFPSLDRHPPISPPVNPPSLSSTTASD